MRLLNPDYINDFGLVNAKKADNNAENSPLWSLEYLTLEANQELWEALFKFIMDCKRDDVKGLYHQSPKTATPFRTVIKISSTAPTSKMTEFPRNHDDYMSPDQLIAFILFLYKCDPESCRQIWDYLWKHWFTYDNITGETNKERMMQPMAIAVAAVCGGGWFAKMFWFPVLVGSLIYSCWSEPVETSGPLKSWVILKHMHMKLTGYICTWLIERGPWLDWKGIFREYFKEKEQPTIQLINTGEVSCEL